MFTQGIDPLRYHNDKFQKLFKEAQQYRLYREALKAESQRKNIWFESIGKIGKWLVSVGTNLEKKYSVSMQTETKLTYDMSSSNCE
jgi:hypothetical protein